MRRNFEAEFGFFPVRSSILHRSFRILCFAVLLVNRHEFPSGIVCSRKLENILLFDFRGNQNFRSRIFLQGNSQKNAVSAFVLQCDLFRNINPDGSILQNRHVFDVRVPRSFVPLLRKSNIFRLQPAYAGQQRQSKNPSQLHLFLLSVLLFLYYNEKFFHCKLIQTIPFPSYLCGTGGAAENQLRLNLAVEKFVRLPRGKQIRNRLLNQRVEIARTCRQRNRK